MINIKREQFQISIRKHRNDMEFSKKRQINKNITKIIDPKLTYYEMIKQITNCQDDNQLQDSLSQLNLKLEWESSSTELAFNLNFLTILLNRKSNEKVIQQILQLLNYIAQILEIDKLEEFVEDNKIIDYCLSIMNQPQQYQTSTLDFLFMLCTTLSDKSLFCQGTLIQYNIMLILFEMIQQVQICLDELCLESLLLFMKTFADDNSRVPLSKLTPILKPLNEICKQMRSVNYIKPDIESEDLSLEEGRLCNINKFIYILKQLVVKSDYKINFCEFKSIWIVLLDSCFQQHYCMRLRQSGLACLALMSLGIAERMIFHQPDLCFSIIMLMNYHKEDDEQIRVNCAIILRNICALESKEIINMIHQVQIPQQILSMTQTESSPKVLYQELECLFNLISQCNSTQFQAMIQCRLYNILVQQFQYLIDIQNWGCVKQLVKLLYAIIRFNEDDNQIIQQLKALRIDKYLERVSQSSTKGLETKAQKILQYFS